jgi:hypothetical protein
MPPIYGGYGSEELKDFTSGQQSSYRSTYDPTVQTYTTTTAMSGIPIGTVFTGSEAARIESFERMQQIELAGGTVAPDRTEQIAQSYVDFIDNTVSNIGNVTQEAAGAAVGAVNQTIGTVGQTAEGIIESTATPIRAVTEPAGSALESFALPLAIVGGVILLTR